MLQILTRTEEMEKFLQRRYATHKRYSCEGSESLIVALNSLIAEASLSDSSNPDNNLEYVVLGMPHRGRLATLVVLNHYPFKNLLFKVKGGNDIPEEIVDRVDDIPTHISISNKGKFTVRGDSEKNNEVTMTIVHNPSHLES
jgi:probable 2-oxoglutarate dehydrogenase E1 component DHKTD1